MIRLWSSLLHCPMGLGEAGLGKAELGEARLDEARLSEAGRGMTRRGKAWQCWARHGYASRGRQG